MISKFITLINDDLETSSLFPSLVIENLVYVPSVSDLLRGRTDSIWTTLNSSVSSKFNANERTKIPINFDNFEDLVVDAGFLGKWKQRVKISPKKVFFGLIPSSPTTFIPNYNPEAWRSFILGNQSPRFVATEPFAPTFRQPSANSEVGNRNATTEQQRTARQAANPNIPLASRTQQTTTSQPSTGPTVQEQSNVPFVAQDAPRQEPQQFDFVGTLIQNRPFFDHVASLVAPFEQKELKRKGISGGVMSVSVSPKYNFFVEEYEREIENVPEQILPNIYSFIIEEDTLDAQNTIHRQLITLGGALDETYVDVFNNSGEKIADESKGEFYEKFSLAFSKGIDKGKQDFLVSKFKKQIFSDLSENSVYTRAFLKQNLFPMFFEIKFETDRTTEFAQILKETSLAEVLLNDLLSENISEATKQFLKGSSVLSTEGQTTINDHVELRTWDLSTWMKNLLQSNGNNFIPNAVFFSNSENPTIGSNQQFAFYRNLLSAIFIGKVKDLVKARLRTYEDLIDGKTAPTETVFYKIEKKDKFSGEVLQETWFLNSNDVNIIDFIDTQVKYNKEYTFTVFAYQFILGNKYEYKLEQLNDDNAFINVFNEPDLLLVEVPLHVQHARMVDNPPIYPDVNFITFRHINNQIKILLNGNVDSFHAMPVIILPEDEKEVKNVRQSQSLEDDEQIFYAEDDIPAEFEIFRLNKKPTKWSDFASGRVISVKTDVDPKTDLKASSASIIENIFPNQKYYYTFRTRDNHGHISNPSPIFEVELVDDSGAIYPIVKIVQFDRGDELRKSNKSFRRFVHISPALSQTVVNEKKSGMFENGERLKSIVGHRNVHLGVVDESVWNKDFKIRITSKKTGRKIDLNILFKNTFKR